MTLRKHHWLWVPLLCAVGLRGLHVVWGQAPLDADECAESLMAMEICNSPKLIVGWFGQDYMGSAEVYFLAAVAQALGWATPGVRLGMLLLLAGQLTSISWIAGRIGGRSGAIIALTVLCALPVPALLFQLRARGYQVMTLMVLVGFGVLLRLLRRPPDGARMRYATWGIVGFLFGAAVWTNELAVFLLPAPLMLLLPQLKARWRACIAGTVGFALAMVPRLLYSLETSFAWQKSLVGAFLGVTRTDFDRYGWKAAWNVSSGSVSVSERLSAWFAGAGWFPVLVVGVLGLWVLLRRIRAWRNRCSGSEARSRRYGTTRRLLTNLVLPVGLAASVMALAATASRPRYAGIAVPYMAILAATLARRIRLNHLLCALRMPMFALVCAVGVAGVVASDSVLESPGGALARFAEEHSYSRGIAGYHLAHQVMFTTGAEVAMSSLGGPNFTTRLLDVERYVADEGAEFVAYELGGNCERIASLGEYLAGSGTEWRRDRVGKDLVVYHAFSRPLKPGVHLPESDRRHFDRHRPDNPVKIRQEQANVLLELNRRKSEMR